MARINKGSMIKIQLEKGQQVYFTSDTHYGHELIMENMKGKRNPRKFNSVEEMNTRLAFNINSIVDADDILFHLGDWSFGGIENIWEFRKQINCKNIHIITGNHDHHIERNHVLPNVVENIGGDLVDLNSLNLTAEIIEVKAQDLFSSVNKYLEVELVEQMGKNKKAKRDRFVLFHYPIASFNNLGRGMMHLHGHIHTSTKNRVGKGRMLDVGVDGSLGFKPLSLREVNYLLENQQPKTMLTHGEDYHELTSRVRRVINFFKNII